MALLNGIGDVVSDESVQLMRAETCGETYLCVIITPLGDPVVPDE